jgi:hypothetical protein
MLKPNADTLKAILNLAKDVRWAFVLKWIDESIWAAKEAMGEGEFVSGRLTELLDLKQKIENARKTLKEMGEA